MKKSLVSDIYNWTRSREFFGFQSKVITNALVDTIYWSIETCKSQASSGILRGNPCNDKRQNSIHLQCTIDKAFKR